MKIRIKFQKYGRMKYIGHLDLMRFFQKAIRRADFDICYTQGYHPHQIMSFALPLGVGMISDGEYLDVEMHKSPSTNDAIKMLNAQMVEGVCVTNYVQLDDEAKKSMSIVTAAKYEYTYCADAKDKKSSSELEEMIEAYYRQVESIPIIKKTKKSEREVDLKPLIHSFDSIERNEVVGVSLTLSAGSVNNIKPELVLNDFFEKNNLNFDPFDFVRKRIDLYTGDAPEFLSLDDMGTVL